MVVEVKMRRINKFGSPKDHIDIDNFYRIPFECACGA